MARALSGVILIDAARDELLEQQHVLLARVHRARGDRELALNELRMALWSREEPALRAELASLLMEAGRTAEARLEAEKVLKTDPGNEAARKVLELP